MKSKRSLCLCSEHKLFCLSYSLLLDPPQRDTRLGKAALVRPHQVSYTCTESSLVLGTYLKQIGQTSKELYNLRPKFFFSVNRYLAIFKTEVKK